MHNEEEETKLLTFGQLIQIKQSAFLRQERAFY